MAQIPATVLATSDPLNLCGGFALFPALGTFRSGYVGTDAAKGTIFDTTDHLNTFVVQWRLTANATYDVVFGLCGPAYAARMELEGSTGPGEMELTVTEDEFQAGILFGVTITFALNFMLDYLPLGSFRNWNKHYDEAWKRLANVHLNLEFDVIEFIWDCIKEGFEVHEKETVIKKVANLSNSLIGSWGMFDESIDAFANNFDQMLARPTLNLPIDIAPMIEPLAAFNTLLKKIAGGLTFGPLIGIQIPVAAQMKSITIGSTQDPDLSYGYDGSHAIVWGHTQETDPVNPEILRVELEHTAGFDLAIGLFLNLKFAKFFNIGFRVTWPLLTLLGIAPKSDPYAHTLCNRIGSESLCTEADGDCCEGNIAALEVIFEPPAGARA